MSTVETINTKPETKKGGPAFSEMIVPFVSSVRNVFKTMLKMETTVQKPHLKQDPATCYDVSGVIGFSGQVIGSVVLSFDVAVAEQLVESFAGVKISMEHPDFADAVGELANMVAGGAKKDLGAMASIGTPSVVIGHGHILARLSGVPCVVIPCQSPAGPFAVEVCIKRANG